MFYRERLGVKLYGCPMPRFCYYKSSQNPPTGRLSICATKHMMWAHHMLNIDYHLVSLSLACACVLRLLKSLVLSSPEFRCICSRDCWCQLYFLLYLPDLVFYKVNQLCVNSRRELYFCEMKVTALANRPRRMVKNCCWRRCGEKLLKD